MHHPKSDINRLYLPRKEGGRGLVQLKLSLKMSIIGIDTYLTLGPTTFLKILHLRKKAKQI